MPLPTFASVPKRLYSRSDEVTLTGPFCVVDDRLFGWIATSPSSQQPCLWSSHYSDLSDYQVLKLDGIDKTFVPSSMVSHPNRPLIIAVNRTSAYLLNIEDESICECAPLCEELLSRNNRLRILSIKWIPAFGQGIDPSISQMFAVLFSDNRCRILSIESNEIINEVDLSDQEESLDCDGIGYLSDISFDRAISIDFGKPITTMTNLNDESPQFITQLPLFILKSSGEIYCALFSSSIDSCFQLFGPLVIEYGPDTAAFASSWPCDFACLENDAHIIVITLKGPNGRCLLHCVVFYEGVDGEHTMIMKAYEAIELHSDPALEYSIVKDPKFNDRYWVHSTKDLISIDFQWSWIFSNSVGDKMFDYALAHGALDVLSSHRVIFTTRTPHSDVESDEIRLVSICQHSSTIQSVLVISDKQILAFDVRTDVMSDRRLLQNLQVLLPYSNDDNDLMMNHDDSKTGQLYSRSITNDLILDVENQLNILKSKLIPLTVDGNIKDARSVLVERLESQKAIASCLENIHGQQYKELAKLVTQVESGLVPSLSKILDKHKFITTRFKTEKAIQSTLHQKLFQFVNTFDQSVETVTGSEVRINQWSENALKKCHNELLPKLEQMKMDWQSSGNKESTAGQR